MHLLIFISVLCLAVVHVPIIPEPGVHSLVGCVPPGYQTPEPAAGP